MIQRGNALIDLLETLVGTDIHELMCGKTHLVSPSCVRTRGVTGAEITLLPLNLIVKVRGLRKQRRDA